MTTLNELSAQWFECKRMEQEFNRKRIEVEKAICELAKEELPEQGTVAFGSLKISTGYTRSWDSEILTNIYRNKPEVFPFKVEWKEDRRTMQKLEQENPELANVFAAALTIKERKPSFVYIGDQDVNE